MDKNNNNYLSNSFPMNNNIQNQLININDNQKEFSYISNINKNNQNLISLPDQNKKENNFQKNNYSINKNSFNQNIDNEEQKQMPNNISEEIKIDSQNNGSFASNSYNFKEETQLQNPIFRIINENNQQIYLEDSFVFNSNSNIHNSSFNNNATSNNEKNEQNKNNEKTLDISKTCLKNIGETSYLNAVLHCLVNIEDLKIFFLEETNAKYITNNIKELALSFVTNRLFKHFYVKKDKLYSLEPYLRVLASKNKIFETHKSRNVNDCLNCILNTLDNELNKPNNEYVELKCKQTEREEVIRCGIEKFKNLYNSIIYKVFNWFQLKEFHCNECGEHIYNFNTYNTFQLDNLEFYKINNRKNINIFDCLKFEINKKTRSFCQVCKNQTNITIISTIYKSPKVFIFLLNDGKYDDKYSDFNFALEESINLKKYINDQNSPTKYQLIGIVSIDAHNKQYVSFCKLDDEQWYLFHDETFNQIKLDQIILDNDNTKYIPSILFYKLEE